MFGKSLLFFSLVKPPNVQIFVCERKKKFVVNCSFFASIFQPLHFNRTHTYTIAIIILSFVHATSCAILLPYPTFLVHYKQKKKKKRKMWATTLGGKFSFTALNNIIFRFSLSLLLSIFWLYSFFPSFRKCFYYDCFMRRFTFDLTIFSLSLVLSLALFLYFSFVFSH